MAFTMELPNCPTICWKPANIFCMNGSVCCWGVAVAAACPSVPANRSCFHLRNCLSALSTGVITKASWLCFPAVAGCAAPAHQFTTSETSVVSRSGFVPNVNPKTNVKSSIGVRGSATRKRRIFPDTNSMLGRSRSSIFLRRPPRVAPRFVCPKVAFHCRCDIEARLHRRPLPCLLPLQQYRCWGISIFVKVPNEPNLLRV